MHRTVISTPYPTVKETALEVGVKPRRLRQLDRMMDAIVEGKSIGSVVLEPKTGRMAASGQSTVVFTKKKKVSNMSRRRSKMRRSGR